MIVKICGITSLVDAQSAAAEGADMLGFNFYAPSPRSIPPEAARQIIRQLRRTRTEARMVGVFVNHTAQEIQDLCDYCGLDLAQLSGDEPPEMLQSISTPGYKAVRPADLPQARQLAGLYARRGGAPALLLDARVPGLYGGTGHTADWVLAAGLANELPLLLAGGLTPENLPEALARVNPWGVDVASGVESQPGVKDRERMAVFIRLAREYSGAVV